MPVVGTLTVDLVANTAQFSGDLGKAANDVNKFADSAEGAGGRVDYSMTSARHGVMLLGEEFGVHLPRGITTFIAGLAPVGAAMEAAFPFLAIAVGATLLIEHLVKLHEAAGKIDAEWTKIGGAADSALNNTKDKILQAEIEADKLSGNYLDALHKKLILIDHQSMKELGSEFDHLAEQIDTVLQKTSRGAILTALLGEGAGDKVKAEFDTFREQYENLLSTGKNAEARGVLVDEIIHAQEQLQKYQAMPQSNPWVRDAVKDYQQLINKLNQLNALQDYNTTLTEKRKTNTTTQANQEEDTREYDAAKRVYDLISKAHGQLEKELEKQTADNSRIMDAQLRAQVTAELKAQEDIIRAVREENQFENSMAELKLRGAQEHSKFLLAIHQVSISEQMQQELKAENADFAAKQTAYAKESALLAKYGAQESLQQQKLDHQLELEKQQHENRVTQIIDAAETERFKRIQQGEQRIANAFAQSIAHSLVMNKSLADGMRQIGEQMLETSIQQSLLMLLHKQTIQEKEQSMDAKHAASSVYASVMEHIPYPVNVVLAPIAAVAAFAGVMAFAEGGTVPGTGSGDTVPAMLSPGETVVSKKLTDEVRNTPTPSKHGDVHIHTSVNAVDAAGFEGLLQKHAAVVSKHVRSELRKAHKRG